MLYLHIYSFMFMFIQNYCTVLQCSLQGSCNHIAGLLFRVEYAVRMGLTDTSCTSQQCQWNLPSTKVMLNEPRLVAAQTWTKASYMNHGNIL